MTRATPARPTLMFAGIVLATLAMFRVLDIAIVRLAVLPAAAYDETVFLDNMLVRWWRLGTSHIPWWLAVAIVVLVAVVAVTDERRFAGAWRRRLSSLFAGWDALEEGAALRVLVVAITGVSAWALSSYARNLYVGQLHLADRLLVIALWMAIAWRPLFVFPFALAAGAVSGQFTVPLGFITWTEMAALLRFPVLFGAFWIVRAATGERRSDVFIFCWCCLLATTYWTSGLGKLRIEWFTHPHISLLLLGAYANGWLAFLDSAVVTRAADVLARVDRPLMLFTLAVECGALALLWRRWSLVGFVVLATMFHLGVFAVSGIFFWKWITVDACLLVFLLRGQRLSRLAFFTPARFALSVAAIVAGPLWVSSENLTWFDTPLTYSLRFEGVDARGVSYALPAGFFRPYTEAFALGTFAYISPHVQLTRGMGITMDQRLAESLEASRSPADVFAIEAAAGTVRFDSTASATFDDFVARYAAGARCSAERDPLVLRIAGVPRHLWTFPLQESLPCDVSLVTVRVFELTSFRDGTAMRLIRRRLLRDIDVTSRRRPGRG